MSEGYGERGVGGEGPRCCHLHVGGNLGSTRMLLETLEGF